LKSLVLDSVSSPITKRVYNLGLDEFFAWYGQEPRAGFTKATDWSGLPNHPKGLANSGFEIVANFKPWPLPFERTCRFVFKPSIDGRRVMWIPFNFNLQESDLNPRFFPSPSSIRE
jgi:hypothetical protein